MGKQSKRPSRAARDIHATIRADAEALKAGERFGVRYADEFPGLAALLDAGREATRLPHRGDLTYRTSFNRTRAVELGSLRASPSITTLSRSTGT